VYFVHAYGAYPSHALDHWGSVIGTLALDDWGAGDAPASDAWRSPFRFPGQYADDGLPFVYNRFRYYDPVAGQYLSPDPLGLGVGANAYGYCPNPIGWRDPFGLSCGIPPGQHSVYVLEKGPPPAPPTVIYVGITRQSPHDRLSQHKAKPPGGVTPDSMRIIATGPPQVPDRTAARLIESSILNNSIQPGNAGALSNKDRPVNTGTYYHSNIPSACPPGTTHMPASATNALLANPGTTIT
jgi:RHS repeat-associated protein